MRKFLLSRKLQNNSRRGKKRTRTRFRSGSMKNSGSVAESRGRERAKANARRRLMRMRMRTRPYIVSGVQRAGAAGQNRMEMRSHCGLVYNWRIRKHISCLPCRGSRLKRNNFPLARPDAAMCSCASCTLCAARPVHLAPCTSQ